MHPSAPEDLHGLVSAFGHTAQAVVDLTSTLSERDFGKPTQCPGWTVKDHVSHVTSLELAMLGRPDRHVEVPDYDYLRSDFARSMENGVELRRPRTGQEVVEELQRVLAERMGRLHDTGLSEETMVETVLGDTRPLPSALRLRVFDVWCHEQDIRTALGRIGNLDSPAAAVSVDLVLKSLPQIVVRRAKIEPGKVVMVELTGPVQARAGIRVERGDDGTPVGREMFSRGTDETGPIPAIGKTTNIQMATEPFMRRAAGRQSVDELHYTVFGDDEIARKVLEALVITP